MTGLRFFAAFYVLFFHVDLRKPLDFLPRNIISQGAVGVNIFFILSGFILFYNYFSKNVNFVEFILKRISKIYPVYLVGLILSGLVYFMVDMKVDYPLEVLIMNVMMIQSYLPSFSMVWYGGGSWSISTEFFFYFCFPIILTVILKLSKKGILLSMVTVYILSIIPGILHNLSLINFPLSYAFPLFRISEFICGMSTATLVFKYGMKSNNMISILILLLCSIFFIFIGQFLNGYTIQNTIVLPIMIVLLVSVTTKKNSILSFLGNRFFEYLGKISYSFYIIQLPIMLFLDHSPEFKRLDSYALLIIVFLVNILGAIITYHLVEYPFHTYFNKRIKSYYSKVNSNVIL